MKMVRIFNPVDGADIYCENLVFKEEFKLKKESYVDCDLEMAKAAKRNWEFLTIEEIPEEKEDVIKNQIGIFTPEKDIPLTQRVDLVKYTHQQKAQMLKVLGKAKRGMKKVDMDNILNELEYQVVFDAVNKVELPVYLISRF